MADELQKLGAIHQQILELLKANPRGLTIYEIREGLPGIDVQQHLDRRVRQLRDYYNIPLKKGGRYVYEGERTAPVADSGKITRKLRAAVLNMAHGRCQMCGRTIDGDGIKLEADHKIPRNWGGETTLDNLWAICQLCNGGKRDFFTSMSDDAMKRIAKLESVYERIAAALRLAPDQPQPSWFLQFVANINDFQEDWQKRLRELRYPVIGMRIKATRRKMDSGKWEAAYQLVEDRELPPNHAQLIKEHEAATRRRREIES